MCLNGIIQDKMAYENGVDRYERIIEVLRGLLDRPDIKAKYGPAELERLKAWTEDTKKFFGFLRGERRRVSARLKDKLDEEYQEAQQITDPAQLKTWYNERLPKVEEKEHKRVLETIYRGRLIEFIADKYGLKAEIEAERAKKIKNAKDLEHTLRTEPQAKAIVTMCTINGIVDDVAVADILAVVYDGKIDRVDIMKFLQEPILRKFFKGCKKPRDIRDIIEVAEGVLQLDKGQVIADRLYNSLVSQRRTELSNTATPGECEAYMSKLAKILQERWPDGRL